MTASNSRLSYTDCFELLDKALEEEEGIRIRVKDFGDARNLQMRIHKARVIERGENAATYPEGAPLHGRSVYDELKVQIRNINNTIFLYIRSVNCIAKDYKIESLSQVQEDEEPIKVTIPSSPEISVEKLRRT